MKKTSKEYADRARKYRMNLMMFNAVAFTTMSKHWKPIANILKAGNYHKPHQGKQECARRVKQRANMKLINGYYPS